jgi:hypothetical protein
MALTAKQKAINEKQRQQALANKKANVKINATPAAKPRKVISAGSGVQDVAGSFGGLAGAAVRSLRGRNGQGT